MSRTLPPHERRHAPCPDRNAMCAQLNEAQRDVLRVLEHFGWQLGFVRRQFEPVPVVFAGDCLYAVIRPDGSVDERPTLALRREAQPRNGHSPSMS